MEIVATREPAHMPHDLHDLLRQVDLRRAELDSHRPLPTGTAASLGEKLALDWTYHSNAIEGNTLTLRETRIVLEGVTVGGKSLREHLEVIGHREAIMFVEELVSGVGALEERTICEIHQLVMRKTDPDEAGRYRRENVVIAGASTTPPHHLLLHEVMADLMQWHETSAKALHPVERAAQFHARFEGIHPFMDGNGRTGRLLLGLELMRHGYPPVVIRMEDRLAYYDALDKACLTGDCEEITRLIALGLLRTTWMYLAIIAGRDPEPPSQAQSWGLDGLK
jgi:Fic family protein